MEGKGNLMQIGTRVRSLNRNPFGPSLTVKLFNSKGTEKAE